MTRAARVVLTRVRHAPLETGNIFRAGHLLGQYAGAHHRIALKAGIEFPLDWNVDNAGEIDQSHLSKED